MRSLIRPKCKVCFEYILPTGKTLEFQKTPFCVYILPMREPHDVSQDGELQLAGHARVVFRKRFQKRVTVLKFCQTGM